MRSLLVFHTLIASCALVGGLKISVEPEEQHQIIFVSGDRRKNDGIISRDNWRSYLQFVPPSVGRYGVSIADRGRFSHVMNFFANATIPSSMTPKLIKRTGDQITENGAVEKRIWKFFLDYEVASPIIALMDDDSCFTRTVTYEDFVKDGKVITRGINTPEMLARVSSLTDYLWNEKPIAGFMADFPVTVWTDMLPAVRRFIIQHEFPKKNVKLSRGEETQLFVKAMENIYNNLGLYDEFALLMEFAYFSPEWRERYQWNLAPNGVNGEISKPIPAFSIHNAFAVGSGEKAVCPQNNGTASADILMYPANYGVYYNGLDYKKVTCHEDGGTFSDCAMTRILGDQSDGNSDLHKYYEQGATTLLQQHAEQISKLAKTGAALSHADQDSTIISKWALVWS